MLKTIKKSSVYIILSAAFFLYGFAAAYLEIFPYSQLRALKHLGGEIADRLDGSAEPLVADDVQILDTFLQRLILKKIRIPAFTYGGGGLTVSGDLLYVVTNKGSVLSFDLNGHAAIQNDVANVPMNVDGLVAAGHPEKNEFRFHWFRVNGIYAEPGENQTDVLFVSHNHYDEATDCITQNISRTNLKIDDGVITQVSGWDKIFTAAPCVDPVPERMLAAAPYPGHISGGELINYNKENLLVAIGDYNRHGIGGTEEWATDDTNPYGKYILVNKQSGDWSIFTRGNRNGSGLYIDKDSVVWAIEVGPLGGDELNVLVEGANYGWPLVSYGIWYDTSYELPGGFQSGTHPNYKQPVFFWSPSVAPRGLTKIEGDRFGYWKGDLIVGTMRDKSLRRLRLDRDNRVISDERIDLGHRVRDIEKLVDGKLALVTDDGYLIIIDDGGAAFQEMDEKTTRRIEALGQFDRFAEAGPSGADVTVERTANEIFSENCATCHSLKAENQVGPHLNSLFGRQVGSIAGYSYSPALKSDKRTWNADLLVSFLRNPEIEFTGNTMPRTNFPADDAQVLIRFFEKQRGGN